MGCYRFLAHGLYPFFFNYCFAVSYTDVPINSYTWSIVQHEQEVSYYIVNGWVNTADVAFASIFLGKSFIS